MLALSALEVEDKDMVWSVLRLILLLGIILAELGPMLPSPYDQIAEAIGQAILSGFGLPGDPFGN
jgi:hypothetical protein